MVSSILVDAVQDPTAVLAALFDPNSSPDEFPTKVSAHFSHLFRSSDAFEEIPPLGVKTPPEAYKERTLVRFRAMIQDTSPSPEMYLAKRSGARCGGWGLGEDNIHPLDQDLRESINYANLRERTVLWAVTIPGESPWCAAHLDGNLPDTRPNHKPLHSHKFPLPDTPHLGLQVYYNSRSVEALKSTSLHTFVGILTFEPWLIDLNLDLPNLVPTLHVLFSRPVLPTILPRVYPSSISVGNFREELITWIADEGLAGDRTVAEWVLLCAISRVESRSPPLLPLTLTVSQFPSLPSDLNPDDRHIPSLSHVLAQIFPSLITLPLSLKTLNSTNFAPESKEEDLHSGWLQLPSGSVCIVTESGVTEGGVAERGIMNLRVTQDMMSTQTLDYIFPYSRFGFDTDVDFLVLSEGRKSAFFQTDVNIPIRPMRPKEEFNFYRAEDEITLPTEEKLNIYRALVGGAKMGSVSVDPGTAEFIQNDFVNERKATSGLAEAITSDDLIRQMLVARLLALSMHEKEVTVPIWLRAKALEAQRKARIF